MFGVIIAVHIIVCLALVLIIMLQPGKGYGISETFGGTAQTLFGARTATFITRATTISATLFLLTCLSLGIISSKRSRSVMERVKSESVEETTKKTETVKEEPLNKEMVTPPAGQAVNIPKEEAPVDQETSQAQPLSQ